MMGLAPTSSSFCYKWTYDVFINFRGEDTRHGFAGNLYYALKNTGVRTFFDDEELRRGDEITPTLLKAIENSRIAITIFSKNYASSTFCLNELVQIHKCIKRKGRLVLPIFYDVEPSEVRHQKENYEQALSMHLKNLRADEESIQSWKLALHEVANISGLHFIQGQCYEYQFIERIVEEISSKINRVPLHVSEYPIGLESRVKKITSLLKIGSNNEEAIMVGICGIGGIGKTTIARAVYNSVADHFEGMCFLHDVKEDSRKLGLERIQEKILSKIVGGNMKIKIQDVYEGVEVIKMRLKQKRILLILDNIDNHEQLKKLVGDCNWFNGGSRIIITTRDKHLLVRHGIESIYNMEAFNAKESLELLIWNAFRNNQVNPTYMKVLNHAISYAQGLPLALEVVGSNLFGKTENEWKSVLEAYKSVPNKGIYQVLKVSYEGLEQVEKEIFLDIACFFRGKDLEYVKYLVEVVHGFNNLSYFMGVLVDKSLIKIENDCIEMHDLIQDMGREIVREESPNKPGKRSRLWSHQDIVDVLEGNTGAYKVRMMIQDNLSKCIYVNWDGKAFKSMKELKILIFENVKFSRSPKYLPNSLKVLKWRGYPYWSLPSNFCPKKLVVLDIGNSSLSSLETIQTSYNLGILNLGSCQYVTEIPNLLNLINLKELGLQDCKNLIKIHDSIGYLPKLEILDVTRCVRLKTFPRHFKLPSLRRLRLNQCSSLKYFPEILGKVEIKELSLLGTTIEKLPWSICHLSKLMTLSIQQRKVVIKIPSNIFLLPRLEEIRVFGRSQVISSNTRLNKFKQQREIEGIPYVRCVESKSLLLSEELHGDLGRNYSNNFSRRQKYFCVPTTSTQNRFFDHSSKGASISFWFRNCFPPLWICILFEPMGVVLESNDSYAPTSTSVYINNEQVHYRDLESCDALYVDHLLVYNLKDHIPDFEIERLCQKNEWNYVEVDAYSCLHNALVIKEIGIYVVKQLYEMEDIRFKNPYQTLDIANGDQEISNDSGGGGGANSKYTNNNEQFGTRMKEKEVARNKKEMLMGDDNFASSSTAFRCTKRGRKIAQSIKMAKAQSHLKFHLPMLVKSLIFKITKRGRNSSINQDDSDTITPRISFANSNDIINNQEIFDGDEDDDDEDGDGDGDGEDDDDDDSLKLMTSTGFTWTKRGRNSSIINLDDNDEITPQIPFAHLSEIISNDQEFQQQENITSTNNVEQVPESWEDKRKAKGKEIVIYDDNISE